MTEKFVLGQPTALRNDASASPAGFEDPSRETCTEKIDNFFFDLNTIVAATNNFSSANKLGQGGFGSVYKVLE